MEMSQLDLFVGGDENNNRSDISDNNTSRDISTILDRADSHFDRILEEESKERENLRKRALAKLDETLSDVSKEEKREIIKTLKSEFSNTLQAGLSKTLSNNSLADRYSKPTFFPLPKEIQHNNKTGVDVGLASKKPLGEVQKKALTQHNLSSSQSLSSSRSFKTNVFGKPNNGFSSMRIAPSFGTMHSNISVQNTQELRPRQFLAVVLHARGVKQKDIAKQLGYTESYVGQILRSDAGRRMTSEELETAKMAMASLLPKVVETYHDVFDNGKLDQKLKAAKDYLDAMNKSSNAGSPLNSNGIGGYSNGNGGRPDTRLLKGMTEEADEFNDAKTVLLGKLKLDERSIQKKLDLEVEEAKLKEQQNNTNNTNSTTNNSGDVETVETVDNGTVEISHFEKVN